MLRKSYTILSYLKPHFISSNLYHLQQCRTITKVRLKWVKNKSFDHIINIDTDVKAAMLLKDAIKRSPTSFLTSKTVQDWHKPLGLTIPVLRFLRRYPTLFHEFPHSRYQSLHCFRLTDVALALDEQEQLIYGNNDLGILERLCRLLMMMKSRSVPLEKLYCLKWDLGLPDKFEKSIVDKYPDWIRVSEGSNGLPYLSLVEWRDEFAVSELEKKCEISGSENDYRQFRKGNSVLSFPMCFPRCYGSQNNVKAWMEEFQKLHYISPYEDCMGFDPSSELMEKRNVGLLHEFLSLTIHKKTRRDYLMSLRGELVLPITFTRIFTRYPGIFYLSLKCKTTTVALKEGYRKGKLAEPHPLALLRNKVYNVMRIGLRFQSKGIDVLSPQDCLLDGAQDAEENTEIEGEENEQEDDFWEKQASDMTEESD